MIRTGTLFGTGALVLLASTSLSLGARAQAQDPAATLDWPGEFPGAFLKLESACLFDPGEPDLLVLAGDELVLVRAPMSCPRMLGVASGVVDFVVLPEVAGISTVAITTADGLSLSAVSGAGSDPSLQFLDCTLGGDWRYAKRLAAATSPDGRMIVATGGVDILRAKLADGDSVVELTPLSTHGANVTHLAAGDVATSREGVELAYVASDRLHFVDESGNTFFGPYHLALGCVDVSRVPGGADGGVDSFSVVTRFDYGGGVIGEILIEIANGVVSNAIFGGEVQVADICYASAGEDARSDVIVSSSTTPAVIVLHGAQQSGSPLPFELRAPPEWSVVDLGASSLPHPPQSPKLACADFDLDGDGDLVLAGSHQGSRYLSFLRGFGSIEAPVDVAYDPEGHFYLDCGGECLQVSLSVDVPQPTRFSEPPNRIRVRVWEQPGDDGEYCGTNVIPELWFQDFYEVVDGVASVSIPPTPVFNGVGMDTVLHFEIVPQLYNATTNEVEQRAGATNWAGTVLQQTLDAYMCCFHDEFDPPGLVCDGFAGAPVVTTINRRTIIRPTLITPSQP